MGISLGSSIVTITPTALFAGKEDIPVTTSKLDPSRFPIRAREFSVGYLV